MMIKSKMKNKEKIDSFFFNGNLKSIIYVWRDDPVRKANNFCHSKESSYNDA